MKNNEGNKDLPNINVNYDPSQYLPAKEDMINKEITENLKLFSSIPSDLRLIAEKLQEATRPRYGMFLFYTLLFIAICFFTWLLITTKMEAHTQKIKALLVQERLDINKELQKNIITTNKTLQNIEKKYQNNLEKLTSIINTQSKDLSEQLEKNFQIMRKAYEKKEEYYKKLLESKELQINILKKENEKLKKQLEAYKLQEKIIEDQKNKAHELSK